MNVWERLVRPFDRSETAGRYFLLSPVLLVLLCALAAPLALLLLYSFWTQEGLALDTTPTLGQYIQRKATNSVYGSAAFTLNNWWTIEGTARNDWSSTLPAGEN